MPNRKASRNSLHRMAFNSQTVADGFPVPVLEAHVLDKAASFLAFLAGLVASRHPDPITVPIRRYDRSRLSSYKRQH